MFNNTYKIKKGDTLYRIAKNTGTTIDEIVRLNNIQNPNKIYQDKTLVLPTKKVSTQDTTKTLVGQPEMEKIVQKKINNDAESFVGPLEMENKIPLTTTEYYNKYQSNDSKFKVNYYETPNVRTKESESYKKGNALKNEIKNVVLHYTAYPDATTSDAALHEQFMTKGGKSSHVTILKNGVRNIYASPEQVTFHAGVSKWKKRDNANNFSIGVEFQNSGKGKLTDSQVNSGVEYISNLMDKYKIPLSEVITHSMVAPSRKQDLTNEQYQQVLNALKQKGYK